MANICTNVQAYRKFVPSSGRVVRGNFIDCCLKNYVNYWLIISEFLQIFYDSDPDRNHTLIKIGEIQQTQVAIEFVGIALPDTDYPFHQNPNPGAASILAPLMIIQNTKSYSAPYVIHWDENNNPVYYKIDWNLHLVLRCGVILDFNIILNVISKP